MSSPKLWKSKIIKISQFLLILVLVISWIFSGWFFIFHGPKKILDIRSDKTVFMAEEIPRFTIKILAADNLGVAFGDLRTAYASENVEVAVLDMYGKITNINPNIIFHSDGLEVYVNRPRRFIPGKYTISARMKDGLRDVTSAQDFSWGVLAINTEKSAYLPDEDVNLSMAVLDDFGRMVCDADVMLAIIDPDGKAAVLSTAEKTIAVSPDCSFYGVTKTADYLTSYRVGEIGTYQLTLTAKTNNGIRSIQDSFEVKKDLEFSLQRIGPTRLFPEAKYQMLINIKAGKSYAGPVVEYVPSSFNVTPRKGMVISQKGDRTELQWQGKFHKGKSYQFTYEFTAPNISPEFYLLGKLIIGKWQEARFWQIAADATTIIQSNYRWRNDDGNEITATWGANENTATSSIFAEEIKRLRLQIYSSGTTASNKEYNFQWGTGSNCTSGTWTQVASSTVCSTAPFCMHHSSLINASTTVARLSVPSSGIWLQGSQRTDQARTTAINFATRYQYSEIEYSFRATTSTPENTAYYFRHARHTTALNTYSQCAGLTMARANIKQIHYRWRNDDGTEVTASWGANEDTATTSVNLLSTIRLRLETSNTGSTASSSQMYALQYGTGSNPQSGTWTTVPASGLCGTDIFCMNASSLTEGSATTNVASGLTDDNTTFVAGLQKETNATTTHISIDKTKFSEIEYAFQVTSNAPYSTTYYFRLATTTGNGVFNQLATYSVTPQLTTQAAPASFNQNHYRWRNDDNNEASATWGANEDIATSTMYANRVRRLRFAAANTGGTASRTFRLEYGTNSDCTTGSWTQMTSVSACAATDLFCMAQSQLIDTSATTDVASGVTNTGSFVAGEQVESDSDTASISVAGSSSTENEYAFKINTSTPEETTYYFRMSNAGTALDTYGSCAQLTTGAANLNQVHYRWRDDFEAESGTTWQNNLEDTATTSVDISKVMRLRVEVSNKRYASSSQMYILQYSTQATPTNDSWTTIPQTGSCLTAPFCMNASSLTEGGTTTNISPGLTDDNTTFVAGLQKESNATTTHISIDTTKYTEIEYAFQVTSNAAGNTAYYFRLATTTAAGAYGQLGTYSVTPQLTTKVTSSGAFDAYASSTISFDASLPVLFASQTSTITKFGAIKIQDDRGTSAGWTLNLAGNDWKTTTGDMQLDYDGTGTDGNLGKLCANPNAGNLYAETGSLTNVNKGALDCFSAGVTVIDVVAASASYGNGTYWLTDMSLGQFFPSNPTAAIYTTTIVFTLQ